MAQSQAQATSGGGRLKDRIALVTGSSSGIGRGIAVAFAHEGADLAINYPDDSQAANAKAVAEEVERLGRRAVVVRADVSVEDAARSLVDATIDAFQRVDILVNNAGIASGARIEDMCGVGSDDGCQPRQRAPVHPLRPADHVPAELRKDHQRRLATRLSRISTDRALCRRQ